MRLVILLALLANSLYSIAQVCNPSGNLIIYSNYDGGPLTINVDQNIPNLYIGVASYEFSRIVITGAYAGNVAGVWYAGFNADNNHCNLSTPWTTTITGVPAGITQIEFLPNSPIQGGGLPTYIIYGYQCQSPPSSGNSPEQLIAYFSQMGPASFRYHQTQYGCWTGTYNVSAGGNCCIGVAPLDGCTDPDACNFDPDATVDDGSCIFISAYILDWDGPTEFCVGDGNSDLFAPGIILQGNSGQNQAFVLTDANGIIQYAGGTFFSELDDDAPGICYAYAIAYQDGLTGLNPGSNIANLNGCYDLSAPVILTKQPSGCTDPEAGNYDPNAFCDDGSCVDCVLDLAGCTDPNALNYYAIFTQDDGSCIYASEGFCGDGTIWDPISETCIANLSCPADLNYDGIVNTGDLVILLSEFATICP